MKSALDAHDRDHMMVALPTGYGKTIPMLLLGHLLPAGTNSMTSQNSTFFSRLHHNCCDPDNNYWTATGGRLQKTGHYSSVGCPGHVRYFSGLTWNFPLPQFIYVINQSFPSPPHISSKVYTGLSCPVLLLSTISISQVPREEFDDVLAQRPQLLVCSVEFLQNTAVGLFPFNPIGTQGFFCRSEMQSHHLGLHLEAGDLLFA